MILGRLLLRFLLVPLGAGIAILTAALFVIVAHWNRFAALVADRSNDEFIIALFFIGSWIVLVASVSAAAMLLPAILGGLIAEIFAIRSWIYHAANGGLSAWIGLQNALVETREPYDFYGDPLIVVGAGIAAGFAYWAVAGWSAGFWKPVFAEPEPAPTPVLPA
jgi:hypothetical protein